MVKNQDQTMPTSYERPRQFMIQILMMTSMCRHFGEDAFQYIKKNNLEFNNVA